MYRMVAFSTVCLLVVLGAAYLCFPKYDFHAVTTTIGGGTVVVVRGNKVTGAVSIWDSTRYSERWRALR